MKRRRFLQAMVAAPAAPALVAQQPVAPANQAPLAAADIPKIETALADDAAEMVPRFFSAEQFAALRKLSDIIMPPIKGTSGALVARAPEFLDFLIGESAEDRRQLYRTGLDLLNAQAKKRFDKPFAEVDATQAAALLAPLRDPWTYDPPAEPLARFLRAAKQDVRTATLNSREGSGASGGAGGRRGGGVGLYWYPTD